MMEAMEAISSRFRTVVQRRTFRPHLKGVDAAAPGHGGSRRVIVMAARMP